MGRGKERRERRSARGEIEGGERKERAVKRLFKILLTVYFLPKFYNLF